MSNAPSVTEPHSTESESQAAPESPRRGEAGPVRISRAETSERDEIGACVARLGGTLFQSPVWGQVVEAVFGHRPFDLIARRDGELVGFLPLMKCRGLLGKSHLISMPYGVYGGPVATDEQVQNSLIQRALAEAESEGVGRLELRSETPLAHEALQQSDRYVTFIKDLPSDPEEVVKSMKKDERRLVRRAVDKHGLELDEGPWFLHDLERLFHSSKQRLGSPGLPGAWFAGLAKALGERAPIHIVRRGEELLAASMCFVDGKDLRMYYIGTTPEANRAYSATSFMIAELQRWAIERGLERFDLGRSRRDAGAVKFKTNQGFSAEALHYAYGLVRSKELPTFTPSNPRTAFLRKTWSRMPGWMCRRMSTRLSRFLP